MVGRRVVGDVVAEPACRGESGPGAGCVWLDGIDHDDCFAGRFDVNAGFGSHVGSVGSVNLLVFSSLHGIRVVDVHVSCDHVYFDHDHVYFDHDHGDSCRGSGSVEQVAAT